MKLCFIMDGRVGLTREGAEVKEINCVYVFVFMFFGSTILMNVLVAACACLQGFGFGLFFIEQVLRYNTRRMCAALVCACLKWSYKCGCGKQRRSCVCLCGISEGPQSN